MRFAPRTPVEARTEGATSPKGTGPTVAQADRRRAFERLSRQIARCTLCPLSQTRSHVVVYRGSPVPRVVFVGEAPGAEEDRQGVPFVGRSGKLLDRALETIGPALGSYGVLNVLKCRPPGNRFDPRAAESCRPYLDRQLDLLRPRAVAPLGAQALRALDPRSPPILVAAGAARRGPDGWLFPLIHPAAALRSRRLRERWERDVRALGAWLEAPPFEML
jgi:DNA polymerase